MKSELTRPPVPVQSIELVVSQNGLDTVSAEALRVAFNPLFDAAAQWQERVAGLSVTDVSQKREMKLARESRLALKEIRCNAERQRKRLKEESLRRGKAIDGIYNVLEYLVAPLEEKLLAMETFAERKEAERLDAQLVERQKALAYFGYPTLDAKALRAMEDQAFQVLLSDAKAMSEARQREAERIEAERLAKERAEAEERERVAAENARLKAELEKREAQLRAEREAAEQAAKVAAEAAEAEKRAALAKAKEEQMAAESKARAERERLAAIAETERKQRMAAERELKAKKEAEEAAAKVAAQEAAAKAAAERAASVAPDRDKLAVLARYVRQLNIPVLTHSPQNVTLAIQMARDQFAEVVEWHRDNL